jgi:hypothetical protein
VRGRWFLVWDFDGTLAMRPGAWTGTLCEVITRERPNLGVTSESVRPHLQSGIRRHTLQTGWHHILLSNHIPELPQLVEALWLSDFFVAVYSSGRILARS